MAYDVDMEDALETLFSQDWAAFCDLSLSFTSN